MHRQLDKTIQFRQRPYSESNEYASSYEQSDNYDKHDVFTLLKEQGKEYAERFQTEFKSEFKAADEHSSLSELNLQTLLDDSASYITETINIPRESQEETSINDVFLSQIGRSFDCGTEYTSSEDNCSTKTDCFHCATVTRVTDKSMLTKGCHIKLGRFAPAEKVDKFLKKHLKGRLGFPYYHHAIVTDIQTENNIQTVSFSVVEFTSTRDDKGKIKIKIVEHEKTNVNLEDEFIFVIQYKQLLFTTDEIVKRARSLKGGRSYDLFTHNCEHIALWCVTNIQASFQSDKTGDAVQSWFTWMAAMISKISCLRSVSKDFASATKSVFITLSTGTLAACICCPLVCAMVEGVLLMRRLIQLKTQLKRRLICLCCFHRIKLRLIAKLVIGFIVSIVTMIPTTHNIAIPVIGISILALVVLPWACEKIVSKVKEKINPTSVVPKIRVTSMSDIQPGDVLTILNRFTTHDVIVEKLEIKERNEKLNTVSIDVVHYAFCGLFSTRTVKQERIDVNLDKKKVYVHKFPLHQSFSEDATVARAKRRVGEQKFNMVKRRSSHVSMECKMLPNVSVQSNKTPVKSMEDIQVGDVVEFEYCWLPHVAVVVDKSTYTPADIITLTYIHVSKNECIEKVVRTIDLESTDVFVQIYDTNYTEENLEVVRKAQARIGKHVRHPKFYKSSRFALTCKLKCSDRLKDKLIPPD